jgi:hypothetical protein
MKNCTHICVMGVGLDEMKLKKQKDPVAVARVLHEQGRFSVFEATANPTIASTMDWLANNGWLDLDNSPGFPWTKVKLTEKGLEMAGLKSRSK